MALIKKKTKKGTFYVEYGSTNDLNAEGNESLENHLRYLKPDHKKAEEVLNMIVENHLSKGKDASKLRLERTIVTFGRKKS